MQPGFAIGAGFSVIENIIYSDGDGFAANDWTWTADATGITWEVPDTAVTRTYQLVGGTASLRFTSSGPDGGYRIEALEGERGYAVRVVYSSADPLEQFREHVDTITLRPGQRLGYDVDLVRFGECEDPT